MGKGPRIPRSANSPKHPRMVIATMRQSEALGLRIQGWTYQAIADRLGLADSGVVVRLVERGLESYRQDIAGKASELRALELARLDAITENLMSLYQAAEDAKVRGELGPPELYQLQVIDRLLKVIERRARLLGLEKALPVDDGQAPWMAVISGLAKRAIENATGESETGTVQRILDTTTVPAIGPPSSVPGDGADPNGSGAKRSGNRVAGYHRDSPPSQEED